MCLQYIKLKTKHDQGLRYAYVPCGKCADCRRKMQNAWQFRLNSEFHFLKNKGWNVAFATLTYEDGNLPRVPSVCFKDGVDRDIPCFSRAQVTAWIHSVRQHLKRHYGLTGDQKMRYFIATEYGSVTNRPHMHAILAWPPVVSYEEMHSICTRYWKEGYLFPRRPEGDGNCKSFEIVGDVSKALNYVSKYVCKDLAFQDALDGLDVYRNHRDYEEGTNEYAYAKVFEDCCPFHIQSQSLGYTMIAGMSDAEKMDVYVNGLQFVGNDDGVQSIPLYIKNKLVYDNYYVVEDVEHIDKETGEVTVEQKRMCRRKASAFFERHRTEIFEQKAKFYQKYITQCSTEEYFISRGVDKELAAKFAYGIRYYKSKVDEIFGQQLYHQDNLMGQLYLAYNNIAFRECYHQDLCDQWMMRYRHPDLVRQQVRGMDRCDGNQIAWLKNYWEAVDQANVYVGISRLSEREEDERVCNKIRDFFNNACSTAWSEVAENNRFFNSLTMR